MRDTYCILFDGKCEDVACNSCPDRKPLEDFDVEKKYQEYLAMTHWVQDATGTETVCERTPRIEGDVWPELPTVTQPPDDDDVDLFMPSAAGAADAIHHPHHYARWPMEPIEFIAINDLPWWLANVIKYTMRFDAKDGVKDLYKARSYLEMKIKELEGETRFWDKPVAAERQLNERDIPQATA
jgi:hypothetical protein